MPEQVELKVGQKAPQFKLLDAGKNTVSLGNFKGKWLVLYFYPKDDTSGCTLEAQDFTARLPEFKKLSAVVVGISPDSYRSHQKFIGKYDLGVPLLSDPEQHVLKAYGVWQKKSMFGREFMGVVRTTFLIDPQGVIRHIWPEVEVEGHADEVRRKIAELQS